MPPLSPSDRHEPLPSLLALPAHAWRRATRRRRLVTSAAVLLTVIGVLVAWPRIAEEKRVGSRAEAVAYLDSWRAAYLRMAAAQRPRRIVVAAQSSAEPLRSAMLAALGAGAHCEPLRPTARAPLRLDCTDAGGLPYRAAGTPSTGELAFCRKFPPPAHTDTAQIVSIPLTTVCTGEAAEGPKIGRDLRNVTPEQLLRLWEQG